jgi:hypothetical protein
VNGSAATLSNGLPDRLAEMEDAFDAKIAARGRSADDVPPRNPLGYNWPLGWVRRPDGDIVQLQSDPNNRMMYEDLGFVYLSPRETRHWLEVVQPQVIQEQRRKAMLITAYRRFCTRQGIILEYDEVGAEVLLSDLSLEELEAVATEIDPEGDKFRLPRQRAEPKPKPVQEPAEAVDGQQLQQRLQAGRLREVTPNQPFGFV